MNAAKANLRAKMRAIAGVRGDAAALTRQLARQLRDWPLWQSWRNIAAFSAIVGEPDALDPWPEDKRVALPRVAGEELMFHWVVGRDKLLPGKFGIPEPAFDAPPAGNGFDLILVPGLAFDLRGGRLGRGKGFYDRFLAGARGLRAGVCFEDQIADEIPSEPVDQRMDFLVTPAAIFRCGS